MTRREHPLSNRFGRLRLIRGRLRLTRGRLPRLAALLILLCGAGGFIGPGGVVVALVVASLVASVAGVGNILRFLAISRSRTRQRRSRRSFGRSLESARIAGRYVPFGPYLALGIGIALLYWNHVEGWF